MAPGIAPELLDRIFDPYFTTKGVGLGTGLGLCIAQAIIQNFQGEIWAQSEVGKGATFHIELPISPVTAEVPSQAQEPAAAVVANQILVVNDDPDFRDLLTLILSAAGHKVDRAADGEQALDMIQGRAYDCVILNMLMDGTGGGELHSRIKDFNNDLASKCIFITGEAHSPDIRELIATTGNPSLTKPFSQKQIIDLINQMPGLK